MAVAVTAILLHGAAWFVVTGLVEARWLAFVDQAAANGWRLQSEPPRRTGWPWAAAIDLPGFDATRPMTGGIGLRWTVQHLTVSFRPADMGAVLINPEGEQSLQFGAGQPTGLRMGAATLRLPLDGVAPATLDVSGLTAGPRKRPFLEVARIEAHLDALSLALSATSIRPMRSLAAPFASGAALSFRAVLNRPIPPAASAALSAAAWRDAGGRLTVPELNVTWGPASASGNGSARLDGALQPALAAILHVQGAPDLLATSSRAGFIDPDSASAARAVLQLLALASPGKPITLPVELRDGTLTIAEFPLLRLRPLDWGSP